MRLAMVGAGNVATHLSKALINAGYPVAQVWSRNIDNAVNLALEIGANSIANIEEISSDVEMIILAIADDAIAEIAQKLPINSDRIILHTCGSMPLDVLNMHPKFGVIYPIQTFSKNTELDFGQIPLCIEAHNNETLNVLYSIAKNLSNNVAKVSSENRMRIHIAAVFACNFTNYFYSLAHELLLNAQLEFDIIKPLIKETALKVMLSNPEEVQTGPAKRNDQSTIDKHLELLKNQPSIKDLYALISQNIVKKYSKS